MKPSGMPGAPLQIRWAETAAVFFREKAGGGCHRRELGQSASARPPELWLNLQSPTIPRLPAIGGKQ
jgi:hypothetical protein